MPARRVTLDPMTSDTTSDRTRRSPKIVLLRHGETEWSRSGQHTSVTDLPLTDVGEEQARAAGAALADHRFSLVLSSPRLRATRTAELAGYGDSLAIDPDLAEWDYGAYEGRTSDDIMQSLGRRWSLWDDGVPAGDTPGETAEQVRDRAQAVLDRCAPVLDDGGDVLMVAHGHILRAIGARWLDLRARDGAVFSLATGTISELGFEHRHRVVLRWNCAPSGIG